jgi:GT2 family glycosyltransferase
LSRLVFPRVDRPEVSISVVTHGAEPWVWKTLEALLDHTEPVYEVILVDNASPRGMARRLQSDLENVRMVFHEKNRGFGPASNEAAGLARSPLLVFLNSDALVHEGWFTFLRERIESAPDVAAVAPRLLNLDGTLQEAGALLFGDGYTQFVGFGDEPDRPAYRFPREVDYASAACLLARARAFAEVGGFSARYAPAYYEDVDLCLELRRRGYRTLYEPRALVTHARGASGDPELARNLWLRNHPIFTAHWKDSLAGRPDHPPEEGSQRLADAARDAPTTGRILLATRRFPTSSPGGDAKGAVLARWLAHAYPWSRRTLLSASPAPAAEATEELLNLGWEIADADSVARRALHYDAVILRELESPHPFAAILDVLEDGAAVLPDPVVPDDLVSALAAAGVPAEKLDAASPGTAEAAPRR